VTSHRCIYSSLTTASRAEPSQPVVDQRSTPPAYVMNLYKRMHTQSASLYVSCHTQLLLRRPSFITLPSAIFNIHFSGTGRAMCVCECQENKFFTNDLLRIFGCCCFLTGISLVKFTGKIRGHRRNQNLTQQLMG